ncbi:hypothetical protein [Paenibacillus sp. 2KB_22]|uniref:hypothetical protein n=1 Tax=Paenibacillus sp. 2KB_22 TaxID=3232978 RepID=UPI003F9D80A4
MGNRMVDIRLQSGLGPECRNYSADICLSGEVTCHRLNGRRGEKREALSFSLPQVSAK